MAPNTDMQYKAEEEDLLEKDQPAMGQGSRFRAYTSPRAIIICLVISVLVHLGLWGTSRPRESLKQKALEQRPTPDKAVVIATHKTRDVSWAERLSNE